MRVGTDYSGVETPAWCLKLLNVPAEHLFSCDVEPNCRKIAKYIGAQTIYNNVAGRDVPTMPSVDLYVFSPPCVHCSPAGKQQGAEDQKHGGLIFHNMQYIQHHKPLMFIMEEVPEFVTLRNQKEIFRLCIETWTELGYHVVHEILESSRVGVPQRRKRLYVAGVLRTHIAGSQLAIPMANGKPTANMMDFVEALPHTKFETLPAKPGLYHDNVKKKWSV